MSIYKNIGSTPAGISENSITGYPTSDNDGLVSCAVYSNN